MKPHPKLLLKITFTKESNLVIVIMRTMALWERRRSITILLVSVAIVSVSMISDDHEGRLINFMKATDITIIVTLSRIMGAFTCAYLTNP